MLWYPCMKYLGRGGLNVIELRLLSALQPIIIFLTQSRANVPTQCGLLQAGA